MKKHVKIISSILCMAVMASLINSAVYAEKDQTVDFGENVRINEVLEDLHQIQNGVTDRFIVKYASKSNKQFEKIIDEAYDSAAEKKEVRIEAILEEYDSEINYSIDDVLNDISNSVTGKELFEDIMSDKTDIKQIDSDTQVLLLNKKVDSETFVSNVLSKTEGEIEYIQPDYCLELADNEDSEVSLTIIPVKEKEEIEIPSEQKTGSENLLKEKSKAEEEKNGISNEEKEKTKDIEEEPIFSINKEEQEAEQDENKKQTDEVVVAIIDSGIEINHPDLQGHIVAGYNFVSDNEEVYDEALGTEQSHGTHIAGIIAKTADNAKIMPLKCFENGKAYTSDIIKAIKYAEENGVDIVNCSWGSTDNNKALREAMEQSEMFFVCAAGNSRVNVDEIPVYPAAFGLDNTISVASLNQDNGFSYYSNYGMSVDIAAIGRDVESCLPSGKRGEMSGTSMSAGFVSGAAAIAKGIKEVNLKSRILDTGDLLSNLQNKVKDGKALNIDNLISNIIPTEVILCNPKDDFDVHGYQPTPSEEWEQFCSLDNIQIESGEDFTLVLKSDGSVWSWGKDVFGGTEKRAKPKKITGLTGIVAVDVGPAQAFALKNDGKVYAWGDNTYGQLGTGNKTKATVPTEVIGLAGVTKISAGRIHTAAITDDGKVYIWGNNNRNQLGDGTSNEHIVPTEFTGLTGIKDIAAGGSHTMALTEDGKIYAWGDNAYGQLGDGTKTRRSIAVQIKNIPSVSKIEIGTNHSYAITDDGKIYAWGENVSGVLGTSGNTESKIPLQINGLSQVAEISAGKNHTAVITEDGKAYAWGDNTYGQLGNGTTVNSASPVLVENISDVKYISAGGAHTAVIASNGHIYTWGSNSAFQLGIENGISPKPLNVFGEQNIKTISAGTYHNLALREDGTVIAWGYNSHGQLGDGTKYNRDIPVEVKRLSDVKAIAAGYYHSLAVKEDGTVYTWGYNVYGQLGNGSVISYETPIMVSGLTDIKAVAAGAYFSLALKEDGTVYAWGRNENGQLGDGTNTGRLSPVKVEGLENVKEIAAGYYSSYAVLEDGSVYAWGANGAQQLWDNTVTSQNTPVKSRISGKIKKISAGLYHVVALADNGSIVTWGYNNYGQLAIYEPKPYGINYIERFSDIIDISAGEYHSLAVKADGTVIAWGSNAYGQLGKVKNYGTNASMEIVQGVENCVAVSAGYGHSVALKADGTVFAWGNNNSGQLGDGNRLSRSIPQSIDGEINDIHGEKWNDAHEITVNLVTDASIDVQGDCDWFTFTVNSTGYYNIYTTSLMSMSGELYIMNGLDNIQLKNYDRYSNSDFMLTEELIAGKQYYLKVSSQDETGDYKLHLEWIIELDSNEQEITLGKKQDKFIVMAFAENITSFNNIVFELTYNSTEVQLIDLCAQNAEKDTKKGTIGDMEIILNSPGKIQFKMMDKQIPVGELWSGVMNLFEFQYIDGKIQEPEMKLEIVE